MTNANYLWQTQTACDKKRLTWNDANCLWRTLTWRLILLCKSDCQPIFLKKQGTYSLYAKYWLVRPLIKNIHLSSHQYLSNVIFRASLAFQMSKGYVFLFVFFLNWTSRGVKSGFSKFHTHFTLVFRQFWALNRKKKNESLAKTVLKMWSKVCSKIAMLVHKVTLQKMLKSKNT